MSDHTRLSASCWHPVSLSSGVCEPLERRVLLAAELVRDIGGFNLSSDPGSLINVNGTLFFAADDGVSGQELWKSDRTAAGTVRVKDINPGTHSDGDGDVPDSSSPSSLANVNGTLYFAADDGVSGRELWKSDGTAAGTVRVKDVNPGSDGSRPTDFTNVNGTLFFAADDGTSGRELWKSDGTSAGTVRVKDIDPGTVGNGYGQGPASSSPSSLTNVNGTLFFTANDSINNDISGSGAELWKSDGTTAGTVRVKDIVPGTTGSAPAGLTNVNGTLLFTAVDAAGGRELWRSDGTAARTVRVKDISPGFQSGLSDYARPTAVNGTLFFAADDGVSGRELWKSNGTAAGTVRVKDIFAGTREDNYGNAVPNSSLPSYLTNVNGTLFFTADNGTSGEELWKSNGTSAGTVRVKDINPGGAAAHLRSLTNVNGTLFFTADTDSTELWKSDGTAAGTVRVKDIPGGLSYPDVRYLTNVNGTLYFSADDGIGGRELWRSDGTAAGTRRVKDVNPTTAGGYPSGMTEVNGTVYFAADDGSTGRELWRTDGTAAGTVRVKNINPGFFATEPFGFPAPASSSPSELTNVNGTLFFAAFDRAAGAELWKSNGTSAGTVRVKDIRPGTGYIDMYGDAGESSDPMHLTTVNRTLYFTADDGTSGRELWKSDGTTTGTVRVKDIFPGSYEDYGQVFLHSSSPAELTNVNGTLLFTATDSTGGRELWRSDGTAAGTRRLFDIFAGAGGSDPGDFTKVGNVVYFAATTAGRGRELWRSDGTVAGTFRVKDINVGAAGSDPTNITNLNGKIFFSASDASGGPELWKSDGTAAGTVRVKNINPGTPGSSPAYLTNLNGTLYFTADDGTSGPELWKSNGTAAGTARVRNIRAGGAGSDPERLTNVNGTLFFSADDGVAGRELWRSDGTSAGTVRERDIMPGPAGSEPSELVAVGGKLFFSAETPGKGRELWRATPPAPAVTSPLRAGGSDDLTATAFRTSGAPIGVEVDDDNAAEDHEDAGDLSALIS